MHIELMVAVLSLVLPALVLPGCTMIEETRLDGSRRNSIVLFSPAIETGASADRARTVRTTGIGVYWEHDMLTVGYRNNTEVILDSSCRIVLLDPADWKQSPLLEIVSGVGEVC